MKRTCKQCGKDFFLSKSEIDFYNKKKLSLPRRCKECREANKKGANSTTPVNDNLPSYSNTNKTTEAKYDNSKNSTYMPLGDENYRLPVPKKLAVVGVAIILIVFLIITYLSSNTSKDTAVDALNATNTVSESEDTAVDVINATNTVSESEDIAAEVINDTITVSESEDTAVDVINDTITVSESEDTAVDVINDTNTESSSEEIVVVQNTDYRFRNNKLLEQHYDKHGKDMGFSSAGEYEKAASDVINNPSALSKTEAEDGDYIYYIESTNEFVVLSTDGYIRTYFLPDKGRDYFDRQ